MVSKPGFSDYALLLFLAVVLGSNFMFIKIAVTALPPGLFVFARLVIAALVLVAIMYLAEQSFPRGMIWVPILGSALFGYTLPFTLISWGQERVDSGIASILMATMPLFTLAMAQIFTDDEKPNLYTIAGFVIALVGVLLLFGFDKLASLGDESVRQYAIAFGAVSFGLNAIITKQLTGLKWQTMTASLMVVSVILALPLLYFVNWSEVSAGPLIWTSVVYTGLAPTALGAVLIILVVQRQGASFLSQLNFIVPVVGVVCAVVFLKEDLPANAAMALLVILCGVAIARRRPTRKIVSINKGV